MCIYIQIYKGKRVCRGKGLFEVKNNMKWAEAIDAHVVPEAPTWLELHVSLPFSLLGKDRFFCCQKGTKNKDTEEGAHGVLVAFRKQDKKGV